ncbi:hypothetical protein GGR56DRAFT_332495 [Xylariaceae sp. FL0804]|nr:hypothetical protein GGR56DRAFT_332495 [Xylariaceae sp. FL0804]
MDKYHIYDDDESDLDIHFRHRRAASPNPRRRSGVQFVETAPRPRYVAPARSPRFSDDRFLVPAVEERVVARRPSRSRDRAASSPGLAPIVIDNRVYGRSEGSSDSDDSRAHSRHRHGRRPRSRRSSRSRSSSLERSRERSRERERERDRVALDSVRLDLAQRDRERERDRERDAIERDYRLEKAQRELRDLRLAAQAEDDEKRREREAREARDLREALRERDNIRDQQERDDFEKRLKQKFELERLRAEEAELAEKERRAKEAKAAVEKYKKDEAERILKEKEEAEERERVLRAGMQERLLKSGLGEREINAILEGKKVNLKEKEKEKEVVKIIEDHHHHLDLLRASAVPAPQAFLPPAGRPTYTRMARRHLSLETLREYQIDYVLDPNDAEYVLIKRWVAEPEQDALWQHTRWVRESRQRGGHRVVLQIEEKERRKHGHLEPEYEWVRKKERRRSKSPGLLTYFAGGRP